MSYKELVSEIYKELLKVSHKKHPNLEMGKGSEETLLQRYTNGQ